MRPDSKPPEPARPPTSFAFFSRTTRKCDLRSSNQLTKIFDISFTFSKRPKKGHPTQCRFSRFRVGRTKTHRLGARATARPLDGRRVPPLSCSSSIYKDDNLSVGNICAGSIAGLNPGVCSILVGFFFIILFNSNHWAFPESGVV